ncbi:hypothetical protein M408DRAFT_6878 [Serendipita vermifera MAFF 305830]|uniref:Cyclin-like domain-containing protein n=1 Tax=Serendipita vermifera MAFF 305830 TaxID=933852 RepID=A0A0C2XSC4_SERVB|nr:hypothetical protein M408DRAFT_6878 [Serendipita vermifera MAFF 305830]
MAHRTLRRHGHRLPIGYDSAMELASFIPPPTLIDTIWPTPVFSTLQHPLYHDKVASVLLFRSVSIMKDLQSSRGVSSSGASGSYQPYPKARPSPRNSPQKNGSPRKRLTVGEKLPVLSPEQQTRLQNELLPGCKEPYVQAGLTIAQIHEMSKADGQAQVDQARKYTAVAMSKMYKTQRRAPPAAPAPITAEQRARGRLLRYISLYEDEYREDILEYMYKLQERTMPSRSAMEQQTDIDLAMRRALVDFMVELHSVFHLRQETLYLGINILDRYTSRRVVNKKHYQLVGCVAMWIAAKFEDSKDHVPNTGDLRDFCHNVYEEGSFIQMECHVLNTINWELGHPTSEAWFRCMVRRANGDGFPILAGGIGLAGIETGTFEIACRTGVRPGFALWSLDRSERDSRMMDGPALLI